MRCTLSASLDHNLFNRVSKLCPEESNKFCYCRYNNDLYGSHQTVSFFDSASSLIIEQHKLEHRPNGTFQQAHPNPPNETPKKNHSSLYRLQEHTPKPRNTATSTKLPLVIGSLYIGAFRVALDPRLSSSLEWPQRAISYLQTYWYTMLPVQV
jgi:hypothetical protein